jgi:hypothetical protein
MGAAATQHSSQGLGPSMALVAVLSITSCQAPTAISSPNEALRRALAVGSHSATDIVRQAGLLFATRDAAVADRIPSNGTRRRHSRRGSDLGRLLVRPPRCSRQGGTTHRPGAALRRCRAPAKTSGRVTVVVFEGIAPWRPAGTDALEPIAISGEKRIGVVTRVSVRPHRLQWDSPLPRCHAWMS